MFRSTDGKIGYKVGTTVCGSELRSYLSQYFSDEEVKSIISGIDTERRFTTLAIELLGKGIDWRQHINPPVGHRNDRDLIVTIIKKTNSLEWFQIELWEHKPPNCMVLRDRNSSKGLLDTFNKGLQL